MKTLTWRLYVLVMGSACVRSLQLLCPFFVQYARQMCIPCEPCDFISPALSFSLVKVREGPTVCLYVSPRTHPCTMAVAMGVKSSIDIIMVTRTRMTAQGFSVTDCLS